MSADTGANPETRDDTALSEDAWRKCGLVGLPDLDQHKSDQKQKREREQRDYPAVAPLDTVSSRFNVECRRRTHRICHATPLQSQQQTDNSWY
jgi:hypothetical protein